MFLSIYFVLVIAFITFCEMRKPAWRNGLARWTSNPKVVGSNPTVGVLRKILKIPWIRPGKRSKIRLQLELAIHRGFRGAIG